MTTTETKAKRKVRRNHQAQVADVIVYCKVNIEILECQPLLPTEEHDAALLGQIAAFKSVLRRLGVE